MAISPDYLFNHFNGLVSSTWLDRTLLGRSKSFCWFGLPRSITLSCLAVLPIKQLILLLTLCSFGHAAYAYGEPFQRQVLGIYNSAEGKTLIDNPLRTDVEMVLHYLGLKLDYHDIAQDLPSPEQMQNYRGIIIWLDADRLSNAAVYWTWLKEQLKDKKRVVLLNGTGPRIDDATGRLLPLSLINQTLGLMGLEIGEGFSGLPLDIELVYKHPEMVEFERRLEHELTLFSEMHSLWPQNEVFLQMRMKSTGARSDAVVLTPNGGLALEGYVRYWDPGTHKRQWRLNPFAFLSKALGVEDTPRPDCTTLNGARIYYSHIDGDGLVNLSLIDRKSLSGEIIYEQILKAHPALPFTVSVIVAEVEKATRGSDTSIELARRIFRLPNVEAASHTYSHPLIWNTDLVSVQYTSEYIEEIKELVYNGQALLPWNIPGYRFSSEKETIRSCRFITENLLPPDKDCRLLLWSGNCLPDEKSLAACAKGGLLNMNGGDSRFDAEYPSYITVAPLYRRIGPYYQIHSSNSNENTYTGLWTGPYGGFRNVIQTFENTESPRRVLPINVYYHFYSGERQASLFALEKVYDWVLTRKEEIFPVFSSRYIEVVQGFISTRIERLGRRSWRLSDNGACQTIRFDHCALYPDLEQSTGILGFRHYQNSLYIFLDEAQECVLSLKHMPPTHIYLARATADVRDLRFREDGGLRFRSAALDEANYTWSNLSPETDFAVQVQAEERTETRHVRTDTAGTLNITLSLRGPAAIAITPLGGEG